MGIGIGIGIGIGTLRSSLWTPGVDIGIGRADVATRPATRRSSRVWLVGCEVQGFGLRLSVGGFISTRGGYSGVSLGTLLRSPWTQGVDISIGIGTLLSSPGL